jgi:hypothetical protein
MSLLFNKLASVVVVCTKKAYDNKHSSLLYGKIYSKSLPEWSPLQDNLLMEGS